jgi:4-amino-4-deoxy-L-arabinose transferase-like glycosyltransferase
MNHNSATTKTSLLFLWLVYFTFALIAGYIFYAYLIPSTSSLHVAGSSMPPDSTYFNNVAIKLVNAISEQGWAEWRLYPALGAGGQSSFLAIIYFYFGVNPLFVIPFNALFHSFSAILIYLIAIELLKGSRFSRATALVSSLCYLGFPSELFLVGQIHKDIYVAFGFLLALWSILKMFLHHDNVVGLFKLFIISVLAVLIIASMKPYLLQILAITVLLIILLQLARIFPFSILKFSFLAAYLVIILTVFSAIINENVDSIGEWMSGERYFSREFGWKKSDFLHEIVDRKLMALSASRSSLILSGTKINAKSMIDVDKIPASAVEVLMYTPRAFQVSLLAPFPDEWLQSGSLVKVISSIEMLILYIGFLGLIFLVNKQFKYTFLICLIFIISMPIKDCFILIFILIPNKPVELYYRIQLFLTTYVMFFG